MKERKESIWVNPDDKINLLRSQIAHRDYLRLFMQRIVSNMVERQIIHDVSKLGDSEFEGFARINHIAREHLYGSKEYIDSMRSEKETIKEHYWNNTHHPQYFEERGYNISDMSFLDIIEMVCDWAAAYKAYGSKGTWMCGAEKNFKRFKGKLTPYQLSLAKEVAEWLDAEFLHDL